MTLKKLFLIILSSVLLCSCTGIDGETDETAEPALLTGVSAEELTEDENTESTPQRAVSLSPAITEMIFDLGHSDKLAAVGEYCTEPAAAGSLPKAGTAANPDKKKILAYAPDLLITASPVSNTDITDLKDSGVKTLIIPPPDSIDGLRDMYVTIGSLWDSEGAEAAADNIMSRVYSSAENAYKTDKTIMMFLSNQNAATPDTIAGDIVSVFGENAAKGYSHYSMPKDKILMTDPDIIILSDKLDYWKFTEEFAELTAVQQSRTVIIEGNYIERPTARIGELIDFISANLKLVDNF